MCDRRGLVLTDRYVDGAGLRSHTEWVRECHTDDTVLAREWMLCNLLVDTCDAMPRARMELAIQLQMPCRFVRYCLCATSVCLRLHRDSNCSTAQASVEQDKYT